jgi:hypothetical protein
MLIYLFTNNEYEIDDRLIPVGNNKVGSFYNFEKIDILRSQATNIKGLFKIRFLLDQKYTDFEVKHFDLEDVLSRLGGVFGLAEVVWSFFVSFFVPKLFYHLAINHIYKNIYEKSHPTPEKCLEKEESKHPEPLKKSPISDLEKLPVNNLNQEYIEEEN